MAHMLFGFCYRDCMRYTRSYTSVHITVRSKCKMAGRPGTIVLICVFAFTTVFAQSYSYHENYEGEETTTFLLDGNFDLNVEAENGRYIFCFDSHM